MTGSLSKPRLRRAISAVRRFLPKYLHALFVSPFLFTAGVFSRRHRFLIFQIATNCGMKLPGERLVIPTIPLKSVLNRHLNQILLEPLTEGGNVTLLELLIISSMARRANPPVAFEIGTFDGRTTLNLAANLPPEGQVFTLDLPRANLRITKFGLASGETAFVDKEACGTRFAGTEFAGKITQLFGDSATFDFAPYEGNVGLVFIDGSHALDYVLQDSATALRLGADGAIILWHDYQPDWPGVIRALNQRYETDRRSSGLRRIEGTSLVMFKREDPGRPT